MNPYDEISDEELILRFKNGESGNPGLPHGKI